MKFKPGNRWRGSSGKLKYTTWRKNVFELNKRKYGLNKNYICIKCKKRRKTTRVLHAHHIFSWDKFPKKRYDRNNGVVLCKYCHNGFHYKYKFEALDKPELLGEYINEEKYRTNIILYIRENRN
jgi:5-methylcytosine-specific restriction endonuclease McrA